MTVTTALLSPDGQYRYRLGRTWGEGPRATFVMLNPSTADATTDDATIRRCIGFARDWGMAGLDVVNLYALRSRDPRKLWDHEDPVGPDNDAHLADIALKATRSSWPVVAAWGTHAKPARVTHLRALPGMQRLLHLGITKGGAPRHPLYVAKATTPRPWET